MNEGVEEIILEDALGQFRSNPGLDTAMASANAFFPSLPILGGPSAVPAPSVGSLEAVGHVSVTDSTAIISSSNADVMGVGSRWTGSAYSSCHGSVFDHDGRTVSSSVTDLDDVAENHHNAQHVPNTVVIQQAIFEDRPAIFGLDRTLPCELSGLAGCNHVFPMDDQEEWYKHLINYHFGGHFPPRWGCLFCDKVFPPHSEDPPSERFGDMIGALRARMADIKGHYLSGMSLPSNMRPDPYVFRHLVKLGKLSPDEYRRMYELIRVMRPGEDLSHSTAVVARRPSPERTVEMVVAGRNRRRDGERGERVRAVHR